MAFEKMKSRVAQTKDKVTEVAKGKAHLLVAKALGEMREARPLLTEAGFDVVDLILTASIPPSFAVVIAPREGAEMRVAEVLEDESIGKTQRALLNAVREVYEVDELIEGDGFRIARIGIEMGTPPKVRVNLKPVTGE